MDHSASTPALGSSSKAPQGASTGERGAGLDLEEDEQFEYSSQISMPRRPQSSPAGDTSAGLGLGPSGTRPNHSRQPNRAAYSPNASSSSLGKKSPGGGTAALYKRSLPLYFDGYRKKESAALAKIEHTPIVQLYPGNKTGGTVSSLHCPERRLGLENGATAEQRNAPKVFERFPEFEDQFYSLVRKTTANQKETRGLFRQMKRGEEIQEKEAAALQDKLRIMQSMPDISMPTKEFDLFIKNAMEQQKALDREMSGQFNSESLGMNKHRGSIRHIFPLRNVRTGRVAKGERATIWRPA